MDIKKLFPIPDINKSKRILCIQPHCDDMELTCGATLAKLSAAGTEVIYLTVTDGAAGFSNSDSYEDRMNTRKNEQKSAGKLLGVKKYYWLDFTDAGDWSQYDCRVKIINMLRQIKPDFVITVDPWMKYEAHMDHIKTGLATAEALILYNYSGFSDEDDEFIPFAIDGVAFVNAEKTNIVVDVTGYRDIKFEALSQHKSQFDEKTLNLYRQYDENRSERLTKDCSFNQGEGFKVLTPQLLHVIPEATDY